MTAIVAYPLVRFGAERRQGQSARAVEKIRPGERFDGEYAGRREPQSWVCTPCKRRVPCQSGKVRDASFWDAPQISSAFAAQVIAQAMTAKADADVQARYRTPPFRLPPLVDTKL